MDWTQRQGQRLQEDHRLEPRTIKSSNASFAAHELCFRKRPTKQRGKDNRQSKTKNATRAAKCLILLYCDKILTLSNYEEAYTINDKVIILAAHWSAPVRTMCKIIFQKLWSVFTKHAILELDFCVRGGFVPMHSYCNHSTVLEILVKRGKCFFEINGYTGRWKHRTMAVANGARVLFGVNVVRFVWDVMLVGNWNGI